MKYKSLLLIIILNLLLLCGCWDYRGIDEINIVTGVAVDRAEAGGYKLTMEIMDLAITRDGEGSPTILIDSEGPTIFEAIRNSKKKLTNMLYFGGARVLVISRELAQEEGIAAIMDAFMRNSEPRETIKPIISLEDSAAEILSSKGLDSASVSFEIDRIVEEDNELESTSKHVRMYESYDLIRDEGIELVLPAFHLVKHGKNDVAELNGITAFKGDKLIGFLGPVDTHYYLITTDNNVGGALSIPYPEEEKYQASFEIIKSKNTTDIQFAGDTVYVYVKVDMDIANIEFLKGQISGEEDKEEWVAYIETVVEDRATAVFGKVQKDIGVDIYGYGQMLYRNDNALWPSIKDSWDALFQSAVFDIEVNIKLTDTGLMTLE